jgi:hypothetical protein
MAAAPFEDIKPAFAAVLKATAIFMTYFHASYDNLHFARFRGEEDPILAVQR